jgi:hypothetical protein
MLYIYIYTAEVSECGGAGMEVMAEAAGCLSMGLGGVGQAGRGRAHA